jgi:dolichol-phosphate mannosyltransferase
VPGAGTDEDWGLFRWLNSKVATLLARPFTTAKDPMAGFFALPRAVYQRAEALNPIGYKIGLELMVKCRCRGVQEIPIHFADRHAGTSKLSLKQQLLYVWHVKCLADHAYGSCSRLAQCAAVAAGGAAVDLAVYALLLKFMPLPTARAVAVGVALVWNLLLGRIVLSGGAADGGPLRRYPRFVVLCSLEALVSWIAAMGAGSLPLLSGRTFPAAAVGIAVAGVPWIAAVWRWVLRPTSRPS